MERTSNIPAKGVLVPLYTDLMTDSVGLSTRKTYDCSSIRRWLQGGHSTHPATMPAISSQDLTPGHTRSSLVNEWKASNVKDVDRVLVSKMPLDKHQVCLLLREASKEETKVESLRQLRAKAKESSKNCRCIAESGAVPALLSIVERFDPAGAVSHGRDKDACEAIVGILALVPVDYPTKRSIASPAILSVLSWLLSRGSLEARINAAVLLENLAIDRELKLAVGSTPGVFEGLVELVRKASFNQMAVNASLRSFLALSQIRRNRVKAVKAGTIAALIELLTDVTSITAEYALAVLEMLCKCAEGRASFNAHALAIPTLAHKICDHYEVASEYAVNILRSICKHCGEEYLRKGLQDTDDLVNLSTILHLDFSSTSKIKTTEFLKVPKNRSGRHPRACSLERECKYIAIGHTSSYETVGKKSSTFATPFA